MRTRVSIRGNNPDVDLAAAEDVISAGGSYSFPTQARVHNLVSSSANDSDAIRASGTATVADFSLLAGDTFTIDGNVLTEGVDWTAATSNDATATSLASAIDALGDFIAVANAAVVTISYATRGIAGNSIAMSTSDGTNLTLSGGTLSGGIDDPSGAQKVTVEGLNAAGEFITEEITMDGDFQDVVTVNSYERINRLYVSEAGSGGINAGVITATAVTDATISRRIPTGVGDSREAVYSVPSTHYLELGWFGGSILGTVGAKSVELQLHVRDAATEPWNQLTSIGLQGGAIQTYEDDLSEVIPAGADIKVQAVAAQDDTNCFAHFGGRLVRKI